MHKWGTLSFRNVFLDINFSLLKCKQCCCFCVDNNSHKLHFLSYFNLTVAFHVDIHTSYFCKIEPDHLWPRDWPNLHLVDNQLIKWILIVDSPSNTLLVWSYNTKHLICVLCRWNKLWIDIADHIFFSLISLIYILYIIINCFLIKIVASEKYIIIS